MSNKKTLGVIGGLGPGATAHFMNLVTDMTEAAVDQEHVEMIVFSSFCGSVVARIKMTCSGGSSRVFKSALAALEDSWWTSSMI